MSSPTREIEELYAELFEAAGAGRRLGERLAAAQGQTQSRWQTMWTVDSAGQLTVPQIARRLGTSRQNEQRIVGDLVADGIAELVMNPDHKTSPLVRLTPRGRVVLTAINDASAEVNAAIRDELTPREIARFRTLLRTFTAAVVAHTER